MDLRLARNLAAVLLTLLAIPAASASASAARPSFAAVDDDTLEPSFTWRARDYAARCEGDELSLRVDGAPGWKVRAPGQGSRSGNRTLSLPAEGSRAIAISFRRRGGGGSHRYRLRCLPDDFPGYEFTTVRAGGPKLFMVQLPNDYAAIFTRHGAPVWWMQADGAPDDAKVLSDGTVSWDAVTDGLFVGQFDIRTLGGRLIRRVGDAEATDVHDLQVLPNGDYMIGDVSYKGGFDSSAFGGYVGSTVLDYAIRQVTPRGRTVRSWSPSDHIGLDETGRWWPSITEDTLIYDVFHWNAAEVDGRFMYLSFRHLDAIYKVDRFTGEIVWKLGGTQTSKSLKVLKDPREHPLGGQHDVRVQPNGTITVFNNRTDLDDAVPRAERFRINERKGTATLVESIADPDVPTAACCGSARRQPGSGDWLISWGGYLSPVGAYDDRGRLLYRLGIDGTFSYRASPIPQAVKLAEIREGMNRIAARGVSYRRRDSVPHSLNPFQSEP